MYSMIVDQDSGHLEVCLLAVFLVFIFNECILQTISCPFIPNDLAREYGSKATENRMEILVYRFLAKRYSIKVRSSQPSVTGFSLQTNNTFSGGLTSAYGRSPTISRVKA